MDAVNEFLKKNYHTRTERGPKGLVEVPMTTKRLICRDGFGISVQANEFRYCVPQENCAWPYSYVELCYPRWIDPLIFAYADDPGTTETFYPYVPIELVNKLIEKHGGINE